MEQIFLLGLFLLVGLINVIVRWLRQRREAPRPDPDPEPTRAAKAREWPGVARVRAPVPPPDPVVPAPRRMPTAAPGLHVWRRRRVHPRLGSHADLRRAIVVMTLLGPCRALERESGTTTP
jgi:hypothetical protein